ncbi:hypothetical protein ACLEE6_16730, partial [Lonsdalea quercina]|uniref:hypothetical protein n=1 Tax=Lonsdalea quercina TaxID=71657 RepID=UPI0039759444
PFRSILRFHLQRDIWRLGWSTMKLLAFSLALAIFAGSWALVIREAPDPEIDSKLAKVIHEWEEFLDDISNATEKKWEHFKHSETGKALLELLDDEDEAHPEGKGTASSKEDEDIVEKIIDVLGDVADAAEHTLEEIGKQVLPVIKSFVKAVETAVGKHLDPVIEKVEPHLDQLLHNLVKKVHELDHKLEELLPQQLEVLDKHASPYIQKLAELDSKKEAATK